jgi:16S rRNA (guanine966-N2)-methyltransferase
MQVDTLLHLGKPATTQFDLVFIDPPFRQSLVHQCCQLLENGWLSSDALIYLECEKELSMSDLPSNWRIIKEKIAGQLAYRLLQRQS